MDKSVNKRRMREKENSSAAEYNRSLIEASLDPLVTIAPDGKITDVNKATQKVTGRTRKELIGTDFCNYFTEPVKAREGYKQVFQRNRVIDYPLEIKHKNGKITPVLYNASVYRDDSGKVIGVFAAARDITKRRQAKEELRKSEQWFRSLVEATSDWVWEVDQNGVYTYASPKVKDLLGYKPEEVIGKTPFDFMPVDEAKRVAKMFLTIVKSQKPLVELENTNIRKDGRLVVLETSGVPFFDAIGNLQGYRGIDRDITNRKQAEKELIKKNNELEKFNKMVVDRELRMIELKEKIKKLERKLKKGEIK